LKEIYDLQPETIDSELVAEIFSRPQSLDTSLLLPGATHRSPQVRRAILPILFSRGAALPADLAEQLLGDSDATVRYYALRSVVAAGKEISDDRAKAILVKPAARAGFGLLSGAGSDKEGEKEWKRFLREKLRATDVPTLERLAAAETVFERDAHSALDYKQFSRRGDALRYMVDDGFRTEVASQIAGLEKRFGADSEIISKIKSMRELFRKDFLREGLDVLCEREQPQDLSRIRKALQDGFVEYSGLDVNYLKQHGEWRDIELLISLAKRPVVGATLLGGYDDGKTTEAIAEAMYSIGKHRFKELLDHPMPDKLLSLILARASEKDFTSLQDDQILKFLSSTSGQIRKLTVAKSIRSLSRQRLKQIFDTYMNQDPRYYNVIHWLDMGISLPKSRAVAAARRLL
jgi:hypothetical protein